MGVPPPEQRTHLGLVAVLAVLAGIMAVLYWGFRPARLSPQAAALRADILKLIDESSQALAPIAARDDRGAARQKVAQLVIANDPAVSNLFFGLALAGGGGKILAATVPSDDPHLTAYLAMLESNRLRTPKVVRQAISGKRRTSARLYLQNGLALWLVCSPLHHRGKVVGALLVGLSDQWGQEKRGVSPEEFLKIDFNQ
jgi:hypothetical protein